MSTKKTAKVAVAATKKSPAAAKPPGKPVAKTTSIMTVKPAKKLPVSAPKPGVKKIGSAPVVAVKETVKSEKAAKVAKKPKVVRDSFTMPQSEYQKIGQIKALCLKSGLQVKKSEVLRAGVMALCAMSEAQLNKAMGALDKIKTGRPNKH